VLLARALAVEASVLLADEPTSSLDPYHQLQVMELLREEAAAGGAVLVVLHDLTLAARLLDRVALMNDGQIVADGPPREVLTDEALGAVYRVTVLRGGVEGGAAWLLPWERRPD
jgi:iron complex transport system ATP-binding protein